MMGDGQSGMRCARWDEARESGWVFVVSSTRQPQSLSCAARALSHGLPREAERLSSEDT